MIAKWSQSEKRIALWKTEEAAEKAALEEKSSIAALSDGDAFHAKYSMNGKCGVLYTLPMVAFVDFWKIPTLV